MYALYKWQEERQYEKRQHQTSPSEVNECLQLIDVITTLIANETRRSVTGEQKNYSNTSEEVMETKRSLYRWKIIIDLATPFPPQALDTIIASALSCMATDFGMCLFSTLGFFVT